MGDELYLEPNRKAQIMLLLAVIIGALLLALFDSLFHDITPDRNVPLTEIESRAKLMGFLAVGLLCVALIISLMWVRYFGRLGYLSIKIGSYPPPNTIVVWRTRVRTGKEAIVAGYFSILLAVLIGLHTLPIGYGIWLVTRTL